MEILKKISEARASGAGYEGKQEDAVFVFAGALGEILVREPNFAGPAVRLLAAFSDGKVSSECVEIFPMEKLENLIPRLAVKTAILCVPHRQAEKTAEELGHAGITRILNWSGIDLMPRPHLAILNEAPPANCLDQEN